MKCRICEKEFKKKSIANECSLKCRLLNRIKIKDECWEWQGKITNAGYGEIRNSQKYSLVHRLSYEIFKGEIPLDKIVCHECDNKKCINPDHLWIGTYKENYDYAKFKNRIPDQTGWKHTEETKKKFKFRPHADRRGEKHHLSKFTNEDVLNIRELLKKGVTQKEIASKYGVRQTTISRIKNKDRWNHI
jgi:hypothetical protein